MAQINWREIPISPVKDKELQDYEEFKKNATAKELEQYFRNKHKEMLYRCKLERNYGELCHKELLLEIENYKKN